jgi:hypothetical protein
MTTNVLVTFYSTYGHIHQMPLAVAAGAESVPEVTVRLRRIAELEEARKALSAQDAYVRAQQAQADIPVVTHDDLRWADGIAWGLRITLDRPLQQLERTNDPVPFERTNDPVPFPGLSKSESAQI